MYKIMTVKSQRENNKSLYQWHLDEDSDGKKQIYEIDNIIELSDKVEELLKTVPVDNVLVVNSVNFTVEALIENEVTELVENFTNNNSSCFRILIVRDHRNDFKTLYEWYLKTDESSNNVIYETDNIVELSEEIEEILKTEPIEDIAIINKVEFSIEALINGDLLSTLDTISISDINTMYENVKNNVYGVEE